jgi:hypothetical protein
MYEPIEDRIAKVALAGSMAAGGLAIVIFLLTGQVALSAESSTLSLTFAPASQGVLAGAVLAAGLFKLAGRLAGPIGRRLNRSRS